MKGELDNLFIGEIVVPLQSHRLRCMTANGEG